MKLTNLALGALTAALAIGSPTLVSAQQYGGYNNGGNRSTSGTIASVNGSNITLRDGRQIFLKNGTVIQPTGQRLQVGQQISVQGNPGGNGAINATNVAVGNYGNNGNYGGGYNRQHRHRNGNGNGNGYGYGYGYGNNGNGDNDERGNNGNRDGHDGNRNGNNGYGNNGNGSDGDGH